MQNNFLATSNYWDDRYLHQDTAWDMGEISPPLKAYFEQLSDKGISILIPGCGNSYEAAWLLKQGFTHITLIDISEWLVTKLREKFRDYAAPSPAANAPLYSAPLNLIAGDFFGLTGQYDLIIEQTFFCALDPSQRKEYVEKMGDLLHPGGKLAGLLFNREFDGGPPFGGSGKEYRDLFEKRFSIRSLAPCYNSIKPRAGTELFLIAEKTPQAFCPKGHH
ncbi:MAG TPA: methyltransferase [Puia sp.]